MSAPPRRSRGFTSCPPMSRPPAAEPIGSAAYGGDGFVQAAEDRLRVGEEELPGGQQLHPPRRPREEGDADLVFEASDLSAQGRLRHVQSRRRASHVPFLGDGDEVSDLGEAHEAKGRSKRYWTLDLVGSTFDP